MSTCFAYHTATPKMAMYYYIPEILYIMSKYEKQFQHIVQQQHKHKNTKK